MKLPVNLAVAEPHTTSIERRTDASEPVTHRCAAQRSSGAQDPAVRLPMRVADLDAVMAIETSVYPFPWTRGNFSSASRKCRQPSSCAAKSAPLAKRSSGFGSRHRPMLRSSVIRALGKPGSRQPRRQHGHEHTGEQEPEG